jgi:PHD/YefM family antitoxin component YafN of YafNO toxin-antitoxin module
MTMKTITATELAGATGDALMAAVKEPIGISRHGRIRYVLMSAEHYQGLLERQGERRVLSVDSQEDLDEISRIIGAVDPENGESG